MGPHDDDELPYASTCWPGDAAQGDAGARHGFAPGLALWPMLVAGVVLAAGWQWHWRDKLALLDSRRAEQAALRQSVARQATEAASAEPTRRRLAGLTQALTIRERHLPEHGGVDDLLVTLSALAAARGLRIALFQPQPAAAGEDFARIPLKLRVDGGYREITAWLADIAALPRLVTLQSMQLAVGKGGSQDGGLTMEAVALAYRALDAVEREAKQRAARTSRGKAAAQAPPPTSWTPTPPGSPPRLALPDANRASHAGHAGDAGPAAADPFAYARLVAPLIGPPDDPLAAARHARAREPLEAYALEQMRMVGSLHGGGRAYALVRVDGVDGDDGLVAAVQAGQRLGRRDGVVVRIGRDEIVLRERVWNGEDRWIETTSRLALGAPA
ncbi:pilus assembly protein PilP [Cupriavidus gilardii]|uniref:Pilus assembly protein PilP n=1 Tax=Cupriavidus gilardii TaxID=82541 RepID=A0ABY4VTA1_9BURK|nr:pilus assembly protein PilP [Cupriavidus gilardii]USE80419.1 pilus assembly protein PilP [Cupriavidus gilardii]